MKRPPVRQSGKGRPSSPGPGGQTGDLRPLFGTPSTGTAPRKLASATAANDDETDSGFAVTQNRSGGGSGSGKNGTRQNPSTTQPPISAAAGRAYSGWNPGDNDHPSQAGTRPRASPVGRAAVAAANYRTPLITAGAVAVALAVAASAVALGWGLSAPAWPVLGLVVCALCATAGWQAGALVAGVSAVAVLVVAKMGVPPPGAGLPAMAVQVGTHLLAIAAGLGFGVLISRVTRDHATTAQGREQRYQSLLSLAVDAYWEIDAQYRLVSISEHDLLQEGLQNSAPRRLTPAGGLGAIPWELPRFGCHPDVLDELLADLDARQPFRDRPVTWARSNGSPRTYLVSGQARVDHRGAFDGYWGVARDITDQQAAQEALEATESRYQELFSRIPTPLVLHRDRVVIDANPAALAMFGHQDFANMFGTDFFAPFESGDSRERARRRAEELQAEPLGTALPVADFRLRVAGRQMAVRATSVRVQADGGAAMLAIFVDDTDRLLAEDAVRRSEALLSHLVATSPDLITLTDLSTGRYAMVNQAFERSTGWSAQEAVGRTSVELGVWMSERDRLHFVNLVSEAGSVTDLPISFVSKNGEPLPLLVSAARFAMDRRDYIVVNARDMTQTERARLEKEAILTNVSIGIAVTRDRCFVLANPHFERIYGWPVGALTGQPAHLVWPSAADYADMQRQFSALLAQGETVEIEAPGRKRDGSSFLAHVRGRAIDPDRPLDGGTAWIVEDVTERREFEAALAKARDDAEAASRAKSAFLANTSHELRTPLNGLIGLARLAGLPDTPEPRRREYLDRILDSAQALSGVISDILDVSKIEAGKLQLEHTTFDLFELLLVLDKTYTGLAEAHGLVLRFDVERADQAGAESGIGGGVGVGIGLVSGDPLRVRQIVSNYLSNAIKFTPRGEVRVSARRVSGQGGVRVRIEVRDTGPGIDPATQERLFKPFSQADESTTRRFGGSGLGLSINRELAALMGGEVGVMSTGTGGTGTGSIFWAELPLPAVAPSTPHIPSAIRAQTHGQPTAQTPASHAPMTTVPAALDMAQDIEQDRQQDTQQDTQQDMAPERAHDRPVANPLQGRHVLMVEDNPVNMLIAVAMLERWGMRVSQAHNGSEAVQAVEQAVALAEARAAALDSEWANTSPQTPPLTSLGAHTRRTKPFDAVLMDVQMPVMSGYEATRILRSMHSAQALPIIALTAAALVTERDEALRVGMNDFLTKPIDMDKLHASLVRWCTAPFEAHSPEDGPGDTLH
jgi:PAS domain S-box-containing protein